MHLVSTIETFCTDAPGEQVDHRQGKTLYMAGHGALPLEVFVARLQEAGVGLVVDVRSQPYSRWASQFNRETLQRALRAGRIAYEFLGDMLGGRPADASLYPGGVVEGRPDYDRLRETEAFQQGLATLLRRLQERSDGVVVLCSEGDYHECHRHLCIAPALRQADPTVRVVHLLYEGGQEEYREPWKQPSLF